MSLLSLSPNERKILKIVAVCSLIGSALLVAGSWLFFKVKLSARISANNRDELAIDSPSLIAVDLEAHRAISAHYMLTGNPEKALPHLLRLYAVEKQDLRVLHDLARAYLEAGNYQKALDCYDRLLGKTDPDSIVSTQCAQRGIALFYLDRVDESRQALLGCIERFPDNAEAFCFLGQIEAFRNIPSDTALDYLNHAIELDSTYAEAWYQLARYYMEQKVYTKARELLLSAVTVNPFHAKSHSRLGMTYYYLDYPDLARKSYQTAIALNPDDFNTRYNYGELLYGVLGDTVRALKEYKRALTLNPQLHEAAFKIGLICMKNGMIKEAILQFEQALKSAPGDLRILLQSAVAWERLGRTDRAIQQYRAILKIDELNSIARQKLKLLGETEGP